MAALMQVSCPNTHTNCTFVSFVFKFEFEETSDNRLQFEPKTNQVFLSCTQCSCFAITFGFDAVLNDDKTLHCNSSSLSNSSLYHRNVLTRCCTAKLARHVGQLLFSALGEEEQQLVDQGVKTDSEVHKPIELRIRRWLGSSHQL